MDHFEIEVSKVNQPSCLGLSEIGKVFVIGKHLYRERESMEVMLPGLQGTDDSKEFTVVDVVVPFGGRE